jgi:hypothetical protein
MLEYFYAKEFKDTIQNVGEGVLWWGVKNVDYAQPKLMDAANQYSDRFLDQFGNIGMYLIGRNSSNPIYKVTEQIISYFVKKYGKDKVIKAIAVKSGSLAAKSINQYMVYGSFVSRLTDIVLANIFSTPVYAYLAKIAAKGILSLGVTYNSLQFSSACAFTWLIKENHMLARKLYDMNLEAFFFLVKDEYIKIDRALKYGR